jgi:6-phosphofructokinase 1
MKRIAVLTSGGDAPGMNAAIRAVARAAVAHDVAVYGVRDGYAGLVSGDIALLGSRDVGGIIERAGTVLGSARCAAFHDEAVRVAALRGLSALGIEGLVVIGGNGSQTGAAALSKMGLPTVGVGSTVDNDLVGGDITLGVDTALAVAVEAIDRLRATSSSHRRGIIVEVMGRSCGHLALMAGVAGGAEAIVVPEVPRTPESIASAVRAAYDRGKRHALVVVAEGAATNAATLTQHFVEHHIDLGFEMRASVLGHMQRGGTPTVADRLLGSALGASAVEHLMRGQHGVVLGKCSGKIVATPLADVVGVVKPLPADLVELAQLLSH